MCSHIQSYKLSYPQTGALAVTKCLQSTVYPRKYTFFVLLFCSGCIIISLWIYVINLSNFFRVASLALKESCNCPRASEATLNDMGKTDHKKAHAVIICTNINHIWYKNINTLRPRQDDHFFADYIFKCIFLNVNVWYLSLKFHWHCQ